MIMPHDIGTYMTANPINDPVLNRFKAALDAMYGTRIERVVLFGSRARGDARDDSDYDIAVFLKSLGDRWQELDRLADLGSNSSMTPGLSSTQSPTLRRPIPSARR